MCEPSLSRGRARGAAPSGGAPCRGHWPGNIKLGRPQAGRGCAVWSRLCCEEAGWQRPGAMGGLEACNGDRCGSGTHTWLLPLLSPGPVTAPAVPFGYSSPRASWPAWFLLVEGQEGAVGSPNLCLLPWGCQPCPARAGPVLWCGGQHGSLVPLREMQVYRRGGGMWERWLWGLGEVIVGSGIRGGGGTQKTLQWDVNALSRGQRFSCFSTPNPLLCLLHHSV